MLERWPPAYDADDLLALIDELKDRDKHPSFFDLTQTRASRCQGDIVNLASEVPLIDQEGSPATLECPSTHWLVAGNTCDFERDLDELEWTQIVPLLQIGTDDDINAELLNDLRNYRMSRYFYVPDWRGSEPARHYMAQFSMPVTVHKRAILAAGVEARMSRSAWILLNACFVRFLARDDGRFAA